MFLLSIQLRRLLAECWVRSTKSWERSSLWISRRRLSLLQSRETRLLRRLVRNRQNQLKVLNHPLMEQSRQREIQELLESQQLQRPQFSPSQLL